MAGNSNRFRVMCIFVVWVCCGVVGRAGALPPEDPGLAALLAARSAAELAVGEGEHAEALDGVEEGWPSSPEIILPDSRSREHTQIAEEETPKPVAEVVVEGDEENLNPLPEGRFSYTERDLYRSASEVLEWSLRGAPGPTPQSDAVVELWSSQQYEGLNELANARLQENSNDIIGLLIKTQWASLYASADEYCEWSEKVLDYLSAEEMGEGHFNRLSPNLARQLQLAITAMKARTPEELEETRLKFREFINSGISGKGFPMSMEVYLKALELDGLWEP